MKTALTIAGFDPSSGAGVTADLMVFRAHGLFGTSCITSLTVQSTMGVRSSFPVQPDLVKATLECLYEDLPPLGIKIGMLGNAGLVDAVADFLEYVRTRQTLSIVLDPVILSSSGRELLDAEGLKRMRERLLPLVDWITPNLDELAALTGLSVEAKDDVERAAEALQRMGDRLCVMATGGHLKTPDDLVLTADGEMAWITGVKVDTRSTHGTGCALSGALLSRLVLGDAGVEAAAAAKAYVTEALRRAEPIGHGHGPVEHLWPLRR